MPRAVKVLKVFRALEKLGFKVIRQKQRCRQAKGQFSATALR